GVVLVNLRLGLVGVIPVVALDAVVEQVADIGVGVDDFQKLESLIGVRRVVGDAADRAADGVVRDDGRTPLGDGDGGAHARAPGGFGSAGPALGDRSGLVAVVFGSGGGVRVDDAALVPAAEQVQVLGDVGLLKDRDNLGFGVIVLDTHADDAGAQRVVLIGQVGRGRA